MSEVRRAVARRAWVVFLLFGISCARPEPAAYLGSWVLKFRGQNLMLLTISTDRGAIKGTLVRPKQFEADNEGYFHKIRMPLVEDALTGSPIDDASLALSEGAERSLTIRVVGADRAEARPEGAPDYMAPWVFERASGDAPLAVAEWGHEPKSPEMGAMRERLVAMAEEDQAVRRGKVSLRALDRVTAKHKPEILSIHARYGWPKRSAFGVDAADAFWLLVQHQDHELQKRLLPELAKLAAEGEASKQNYSFLFDRVRKGEGKPQRYGNSTSCVDGKAVLDPVEDEAGLAQRRAELFLPPIEEYLRQIEPMCKNAAP